MMKSIDIVYFDAGSGHRSSAFALVHALAAQQPQWHIRAVNMLDIFAFDRRLHWMLKTGIDYFNWLLIRERVFDLTGITNLSLLINDGVRNDQIKRIARFWQPNPPQAVVSVTPLYNPVLYRSALTANPNVCCVTIPVDFEEFRQRYWFTPKMSEPHYLLATDVLANQAARAPIPEQKLHRIGGMVIDPAFYLPPPANIPNEISHLGLDPALPTGLVSFGGQGSVVVSWIAQQISGANFPVNMIYLCGRNEAVYQQVSQMASSFPKVAFRFAKEPPAYYHHLADFLIGKPGSMTLTEALITETPFIFIKARGLAPVQQGNEQWVLEHGTGVVANNMEHLIPAIEQVLGDSGIRQRTHQHYHRGIFDAASAITQILTGL